MSLDHRSNQQHCSPAVRAVERGSDTKITAEGSIHSLFNLPSDRENQCPLKILNNILYVNNPEL